MTHLQEEFLSELKSTPKLFDSSDFGQFKNFESASREVLAFLHKRLGFGLWMMTRTVGNDWIVLQVEDHYYNVQEGTVFNWCDSFCSRMVEGEGPQVAPNSDLVAVYKNAEIGRKVKIGAYIGVPIYQKDNTLFGTLCAIDPNPQSEDIHQELPLINLMGKMLATLLVVDEMNVALENQAHENQRLQKKAEDTTKAKSSFLANMSHEIRTPLNGTIGLTELVLKSKLNDIQRDYLQKAQRSSKSLMHIVNQILDFSKIEAGKIDIVTHYFTLEELMSTIRSIFEYTAGEKGLALLFEYDDSLSFEADSLRITQILNNLISNAIKFTKEGFVSISVTTLKEDDESKLMVFRVSDSGIGMSEEGLSRLFQEFSQAEKTTTRDYGGTGLGLTISKKLIELMNGEIHVESTIGKGTSFYVTLPLKHASVKLDTSYIISQSENYFEKFKGKKVLVADDHEVNQLVIEGMLEDYEMELNFVNNGQEAIVAFEKARPRTDT